MKEEDVLRFESWYLSHNVDKNNLSKFTKGNGKRSYYFTDTRLLFELYILKL